MSAVRSLTCPNCGGSVELRGMTHSLSAVCSYCQSVIDTASPGLKVLHKYHEAEKSQPKIPLGSRAKLDGHVFEALGYQVRAIIVDGVTYTWDEYLLFNPYQGFRYLSEYNGHWNFIRPARGLPKQAMLSSRGDVVYQKEKYRHYQRAVATTKYALGEFPWKVQVNDQVEVNDFTKPPYLLSSEGAAGEITWSHGTYIGGGTLSKAFQLRAPLPPPRGVFANQPNPHELGSIWRTCLWLMILLFAAMMIFGLFSNGAELLDHHFTYSGPADDHVSSPQFELKSTSNLDLNTRAQLSNDWIYLQYALVNAGTGQSYNAARSLETSSSSKTVTDSITFAQIPAGRYFLRVDPEMDKDSTMLRYHTTVHYDVEIRRDVPHYVLFWLVAPLLLIPPLGRSFLRGAFETERWKESDYG
jgi:hypothetical protein